MQQSLAVSVRGSVVQVVVVLGDRRCERGRVDGVVTRAIVHDAAGENRTQGRGVNRNEARRCEYGRGMVAWKYGRLSLVCLWYYCRRELAVVVAWWCGLQAAEACGVVVARFDWRNLFFTRSRSSWSFVGCRGAVGWGQR